MVARAAGGGVRSWLVLDFSRTLTPFFLVRPKGVVICATELSDMEVEFSRVVVGIVFTFNSDSSCFSAFAFVDFFFGLPGGGVRSWLVQGFSRTLDPFFLVWVIGVVICGTEISDSKLEFARGDVAIFSTFISAFAIADFFFGLQGDPSIFKGLIPELSSVVAMPLREEGEEQDFTGDGASFTF